MHASSLRRLVPVGIALLLGCGTPSLVASPEPAGEDGGSAAGGTGDGPSVTVDGGVASPAKKGPPYPIVLSHGFFGFDTFAGLDFFTYYFEVKEDLATQGESLVFTPTVDPFNDSAARSLELERHLEAILARTGSAKVNLIAHSQGGLDSRAVAHRRPDLVASVTSLSTPHRGTPVSDLVARGDGDPQAAAVVDAIVNLAARPLWSEADARSSITKALTQFTTEAMNDFNRRTPDAPGVAYFSVAGRSALRLARDECDVADPTRPAFVSDFDEDVDPLSTMFSATGAVISPNPFEPVPHDGLVPVASAKWGRFWGCVPADHLDEIGQIGGLPPGLLNPWRHKPFFRAVVRTLRAQGL